MAYSPNGNIASKSDIGKYTYGSSKPHAVTSVENAKNAIPEETQEIVYTPFNKVQTVTQAGKKLTLAYGPDRQRGKTTTPKTKSTSPTLTQPTNPHPLTPHFRPSAKHVQKVQQLVFRGDCQPRRWGFSGTHLQRASTHAAEALFPAL